MRRYLRDIRQSPQYAPREARPSKLDAFKPYLRERIEAAKPDWILATVLFREIQLQGYKRKEGIVKAYIRPFKPAIYDPVVRFETPPGQQMQVDFSTIKRG